MFSKFHSTPLGRPVRAGFRTALLVIVFAIPTCAQIGGVETDPGDRGTGGRHSIQGSIYLPSGRPAEKQFQVRLSGIGSGDKFTLSDSNGSFTFRRLSGGSYQLTIDGGKDYAPFSQTIDIFDTGGSGRRNESRMGQVMSVQIQLRMKPEVGGKPAVVNAALAGVPKEALDLYRKAQESARGGDRKKAVEQLKSALNLHPQFVPALSELSAQYVQLNQLDKAAAALLAALKLEPENLTLRSNYGAVLVQKKQFAEGAEELRRVLEKNPHSARAHLYRGRALIGLRRHEEAQKHLVQAVASGGEEVAMAHRFLGALYIEVGENARAVAELEKYLQLAPKAKDADQIREILKGLSEKPKQ